MALSEKDKKGLFIWVGFGLLAVALFGFKLVADSKPKANAQGCVGPVVASTVIVIDRTESLSTQTQEEIVARALAYVRDETQVNELVTVFNLSEVSGKNLVPAFSRCKPSVDANPLVSSPRLSEKFYRERFLGPLTQVLSQQSKDSGESPITQALIDVSLTQYLRSQTNTLVVFSDLLEHVPGKFSMYGFPSCQNQQAIVNAFRESKRGAQERPKFINTKVQLNIIPRTKVSAAAIACRDRFWTWFFGDNDGSNRGVTPLFLPGA